MKISYLLLLAQLAYVGIAPAQTAGKEHWVATWGAAQALVRTPPPPPRAAPPPPATPAGQPGATPPTPAPPAPPPFRGISSFANQTVRMIVRTSIGGRRLRVKFSNAFGAAPLVIGAAHVALRAKDSAIVEGSDQALAFNGKSTYTILPGMVVLSDPVDLNVPATGDLAVSLFLPEDTGPPTTHPTGLHATYISKAGDFTAAPEIADATTTQSYYWLEGIDVAAPANAATIVAIGDSITDGARSTSNTDHSWPALLAARIAAKKGMPMGVANMGISGNRVLGDGAGVSLLARFDRDVLGQSGVKWVMLLEGINDIGRLASAPSTAPSADELIGAYKQIIDRAHAADLRIVGCTLTPYEGAGYYRPEGETIRAAVNNWIRTSGAFDAVVDFEAATRDAANPKRFRAEFDPGDHLHPNDAGYQAMADAIDLSVFTKKR